MNGSGGRILSAVYDGAGYGVISGRSGLIEIPFTDNDVSSFILGDV